MLFIVTAAVQIIQLNKFVNMFGSVRIIGEYHISLCSSMFGGEETENICSCCDWVFIIYKNYYLVLLLVFTSAVQIIQLKKL